jgi:hypothetical protein
LQWLLSWKETTEKETTETTETSTWYIPCRIVAVAALVKGNNRNNRNNRNIHLVYPM